MENLNGKMGEIFENAGSEWDLCGVYKGIISVLCGMHMRNTWTATVKHRDFDPQKKQTWRYKETVVGIYDGCIVWNVFGNVMEI